MLKPFVFVAWLGLVALGCSRSLPAQEPGVLSGAVETNPLRLFEPREYADQQGNVLRYRLLKPVDFDPAATYPLVIFLHGSGERGSDNQAQLKHGMKDFCDPVRRKLFPCYVLAPQCPQDQRWAREAGPTVDGRATESASQPLRLVFEVVDTMLEHAAIDKSRIYLTGLSMGGQGTWDALSLRPDFFAAAVPICGRGDPATADKIQHVPIWCFHGDEDTAVAVQFSREMVSAIQEAGGEIKYTEYPGVGHDSWTPTYANAELYPWLFEQRRAQQPANESP